MPKQPEEIVCKCGGSALRIEVRKYFLRDEDGGVTTIDNALIVKCPKCGEYAATGEEKKRWGIMKNKQHAAELDPDEPCCDECGKPRRATGIFYTYGYPPDQKGYCRECNDALGLSP